jgi:hypothetical protein
MPKWPERSPEEVCIKNEEYKTGRYPISESNHWHSGIHINFKCGTTSPEVYPFIGGELAAYRISREFKTVPRRKNISSEKHDKLSNEEEKLYVPSASNDDLYELRTDISEKERNEKHCNNYILLKHSFFVKKQGSETHEPINFFILYTNIVPALPSQFDGNYCLSTAPKKIPFYFKYRFFVNKNLDNIYKYIDIPTDKGMKKLFPLSHCTFWEKDSTTYYCNFANFDNLRKIIEISKSNIEKLDMDKSEKRQYVPIRPGVLIYDLNILDKIKANPKYGLKEKAKLMISACFSEDETDKKEDFFIVKVEKDDVDGSWEETEEYTGVLVKKTDLVLKTKGRLKKDNSFCNNTMKGLMVYDNDNENGNARDILEAEKEFGLVRPEEILHNISDNKRNYFRLKTQKYILYEKPNQNDPVEVKIEWDNSYKYNEAVTSPKTAIYVDMLLGYGYQPSFYNNAYYDVALFFKDIDFMDKDYEAVERYFMPPMVFYKWVKEDGMNVFFNERPTYSAHVYIKTGVSKTGRHKNTVFIEFFYEDEKLYLQSERAEKYKVNMLDWKKFFRVLDRKVDKIEDAADGLKFIKENYKWNTDSKNVGALLGDSNPNWWSEEIESKKTKLIKRSIICGHPLELDKEQYVKNGSIKLNIQKSYGINTAKSEDIEYFKNMVEAIDVWGGLRVSLKEILGTDKNNFWFAHPVYFLKHLDDAWLIERNVKNLIMVQDEVIALNCLKKGAKGIYPEVFDEKKGEKPLPGQTYCNHAAFLTVITTDDKYFNFTGKKNSNPKYKRYDFPELPGGKKGREEYEKLHDIKSSNFWCDELEKFASEGKLVKLYPPDAQLYANRGYTVVASHKAKDKDEWHPHFATVRPGAEYDKKWGPMVANVGSNNLVTRALNEKCFYKIPLDDIKWYYNPDQEFRLVPDTELINELKKIF